MNKIVEKIQFDIGKVDSLMKAIEEAYLDMDVAPSDKEKYSSFVYAFYALWDEVKTVVEDVEIASRTLVKKSE